MGVVEISSTRRTFKAGTAFAERLAVMAGDNDGEVKAVTGAGVKVEGVADTKGDPADVKYTHAAIVTKGEVLAVSGAAVTRFARVKVDAAGKLVPVGGEVAGTEVEVVGRAMEPASAADVRFVVDVQPHAQTAP